MRIACVMILGASLCAVPTGRAAATTLRVEPAAQAAAIGSAVSVDLVISGLGAGAAPSLSTFDLDVTFDDSVLSFLGATFGDPILGDQLDLSGLGSSLTDVTAGVGTVNLFEVSFDSVADLNALQAGSFTLANLRFSALSAGVSAVGLSVNVLGDANGDPLTAEISDGQVAVSGVPVPGPASLLLLLAGAVGCAPFRGSPEHATARRLPSAAGAPSGRVDAGPIPR